jgi:hypothetical protein
MSEAFIERLHLAGAPTFAVMALLAGIQDGGTPDMRCLVVHGVSPLSGMVPMYVLMSVFHSAPWLNRLCRRRSQDRSIGDGC